MAGSVGLSTGMAATAEAWMSNAVIRKQWDVEFSRFFNFPRWRSDVPAGLRTLPKGKIRSKGTWMTSASPGRLVLCKPHDVSTPVLSVTVLGYTIEEHFVSNLLLSWPQVSCVSQCPMRGSRVVFASYNDLSSQTQKFAMRFSTCSDAEAFLNFVKESLRGMADNVPPESCLVCENSSPSEIMSSNRGHPSSEEPITMYDLEMPASHHNKDKAESSRNSSSYVHPVVSGLPPTFIELLTNCSSNTEKGQIKPIDEIHHASVAEEHRVNPSLQDTSNQLESMSEADMKSKIVECMSDATFHEMLFKLEKVIDELGGNLALDMNGPSCDERTGDCWSP